MAAEQSLELHNWILIRLCFSSIHRIFLSVINRLWFGWIFHNWILRRLSSSFNEMCGRTSNGSLLATRIYSLHDVVYASNLDEKARSVALEAALKLVRSLERPEEVVMRQAFETHTHNLCIRLGIDLKIFHILMKQGDIPISATELADISGAERLFIVRIMRIITALGFAREVGVETYSSSPMTKAITVPALEACMIHSFEHAARVNLEMPEYFKKHGYKSPDDPNNGPFQHAFHTKLTYFEFIHSDARKLQNFNTFMSGNRSCRNHWVEWFPVRETLFHDFEVEMGEEKGVLLVDMGGGMGHDLERFLQFFPESSGFLVLEELPATVARLKDFGSSIQPISHDLFIPQPILGAKAYYTHFLLHDFPDHECRKILRHVMKAMKPGYSRILLNETVLPDIECPSFFAAGDITMMAVLAGMKRSKVQWTELLQSVGLEVVKVWESPYLGDYEGVIEAMLK